MKLSIVLFAVCCIVFLAVFTTTTTATELDDDIIQFRDEPFQITPSDAADIHGDDEGFPLDHDDDDAPHMLDYISEGLPTFETMHEYFAFYFDATPTENALLLAEIVKAAKKNNIFKHRAQQVALTFGMPLEKFDAQYEYARQQITALADQLHIHFDPFITTYAELLEICTHRIDTTPTADAEQQQQLLTLLAECEEYKSLFTESYTLLSHEEENSALRSIIYLNKPINWAFSQVRSHKCAWCKKIVGYVRSKACAKAGDVVCGLIITAITDGYALPFKKKICNSPINLSGWLAKGCNKLVSWLGSKTGITAQYLCTKVSFPSLHISAHHGAIVNYDRHSLTIGSPC